MRPAWPPAWPTYPQVGQGWWNVHITGCCVCVHARHMVGAALPMLGLGAAHFFFEKEKK